MPSTTPAITAPRITQLEIAKEYLKFSAAHFTIFSATERERLHGHNYSVTALIDAPVGDNGMCFSYGIIKQKVSELCEVLDEYLHLPSQSPFMQVTEDGDCYLASFNGEQMRFLKSDTLLLPIRNATVEEYAWYVLNELLKDEALVQGKDIQAVTIKIASGPGQSGSARWERG